MRAALKDIDSQSFTMFNPIQLERFQSADNFSITSEDALLYWQFVLAEVISKLW